MTWIRVTDLKESIDGGVGGVKDVTWDKRRRKEFGTVISIVSDPTRTEYGH